MPFVVIAVLGANRDTDSFFLHLSVSTFTASLLASNLDSALLPVLRSLEGHTNARQVVRKLVVTVAIGGFGACMASLSLIELVKPGPITAGLVLAGLALCALGSLQCISSILTAVNFSIGHFGLPLLSLGSRSIVAISLLLIYGESATPALIASALAAGECIRVAVLLRSGADFYSRRELGAEFHFSHRKLWAVVLPAAGSMLIIGLNPIIDRAFAAQLEAGSVGTLELADKLFHTPMVLISTGVMSVVAARWSHFTSAERVDDLQRDYWRTQIRMVALAAVGSLVIVVLVQVVLEFGSVASKFSVKNMLALLVAMAFGSVPNVVSIVTAKLLQVLHSTSRLPAVALVALLVNCGLDWILGRQFGLPGIGWASTVTRVFGAGLMLRLAVREFTVLSERIRPGSSSRPSGQPSATS